MTPAARSSALVALLVVACGGSAAGVAATNTAADQAHLAAQASDPRAQDPTASTAGGRPLEKTAAAPSGTSAAGSATTSGDDTNGSKTPAAVRETRPPKEISARHVLVQWMGSERAGKSVLRTREQALALIQEVQRRARAGEDLGRLAVEYSDEPNAGPRGGSLGRFGRGQMVGAFDTAAFKLHVDEVSEVVETPFGFHVIQRTE